MKKIDLGQTIGILANIGVIVGIAFIGVEISQNSRQLAAQSQFSIASVEIAQTLAVSQDPELAELHIKARNGEDLTEAEFLRLFMQARLLFQVWEYEFLQIREGNLEDDGTMEIMIRGLLEDPMRVMIPGPTFEQAWASGIALAHPEFRAYLQEIRSSMEQGE